MSLSYSIFLRPLASRRRVLQGLGLILGILGGIGGPRCVTAGQPPDILVTSDGTQTPCKILKLADGSFVVSINSGESRFPLSEVVEVRLGGKSSFPKPLIGSATTTFDLALGNQLIRFVAVAPLLIQDVSPYPRRSTYYSEPSRYLIGHLKHAIPHPLREIRISFSFWGVENTFLGQQEYGRFDVKPGEAIPFAIDLIRPRGRGSIEKVTAQITAFQSRRFKQKNYLSH